MTEEWIDLDEPRNGGCRPCCTVPHGKISLGASIFALFAWIFAMVGLNSCNFLQPNSPGFLYCHPPPDPKSQYGSCGDCHCINGEKPCPSDPGEIPMTNVPDDWLKQLQRLEATNPYVMTCNPYNTTNAITQGLCTQPMQDEAQLELWEVAACGIIYDLETLDADQCPTRYSMKTYNSENELLDAGAEMTHWGACGACSTTKDLGVYLEYPDLTGKGQECSVRFLASGFEEGTKCFQEVGYTRPCAEAWMYNVVNTKNSCFDTCFDFTFLSEGHNNGPAPSCKLADCLNCDEVMSGPGFQTVAARSRRRSGLLSRIVRDCDNLLIVDHKEPCKVTQAKLRERQLQGQQSSMKPEAPAKYTSPTPTETCMYMDASLGLGGYSVTQGNTLFSLAFGGDRYDSRYQSCARYDWSSVLAGFWRNQKEIFGGHYSAALAFGVIAVILGGITTLFTWCSTCVVYHAKTWKRMAIIYAFCSFCMFMTMIFFGSDVCMNGCTLEKGATMSILSGFFFLIAAGLTFKSSPRDASITKASCCCCPSPIAPYETAAYKAVPAPEEEKVPSVAEAKESPEEEALVTATEQAQPADEGA